MAVLSLIIHLVPMLLLSLRFETLAARHTEGPLLRQEVAPSAVAYARQRMEAASVAITEDGFVVTGLQGDPRVPCQGACSPEGYDYRALQRALLDLRAQQPRYNRVVVLPQAATPYEVVLKTIDTAKEIVLPGGQRQPLFNVVQLAEPAPVAGPEGAGP